MNFLIDPENITKFNRTKKELELVLLFWICAAGKNAKTSAKALNLILQDGRKKFNSTSPFEIILNYRNLPNVLKKYGIGCYNHKAKSMIEVAKSNINLSTCSAEDLEKFYGIGCKSSRCFLIHSRENARYAGLDVHILNYMRDLGYDVPKTTPTGRKYKLIEQQFLELVDKSGLSVAEFDLEIWKKYSKKPKKSRKK